MNWLMQELRDAKAESDAMPVVKVRRVKPELSDDEEACIAITVAYGEASKPRNAKRFGEVLITELRVRGYEVKKGAAMTQTQPPIPMLLWCPECGSRHIDEGDFATKVHHTHACQGCGMVWRSAVVPTVGVQFLPGYKNK